MWINEKTLGVFILHSDIRYECWKEGITLPGVLDDEILSQNGYALLTQNKPSFDSVTHKLTPRSPVKTDNGWFQDFDVVELDPTTVLNNRNQKAVELLNSLEGKIHYGNIKAIQYLIDNDTDKLNEWKAQVIEIKNQIENLKAALPNQQPE